MGCRRGCARDRETYAENGVGAKFALVRGSVRGAQGTIHSTLVQRLEVPDGLSESVIDVFNGVAHSFPGIAMLIFVAQFDGLMNASRSTRRHGGATLRAANQRDVDLYRGIAAGVQYLACVNRSNSAVHSYLLRSYHDVSECIDGSSSGFLTGLPLDRRRRLPKFYQQRDHDGVTAQFPCN